MIRVSIYIMSVIALALACDSTTSDQSKQRESVEQKQKDLEDISAEVEKPTQIKNTPPASTSESISTQKASVEPKQVKDETSPIETEFSEEFDSLESTDAPIQNESEPSDFVASANNKQIASLEEQQEFLESQRDEAIAIRASIEENGLSDDEQERLEALKEEAEKASFAQEGAALVGVDAVLDLVKDLLDAVLDLVGDVVGLVLPGAGANDKVVAEMDNFIGELDDMIDSTEGQIEALSQ